LILRRCFAGASDAAQRHGEDISARSVATIPNQLMEECMFPQDLIPQEKMPAVARALQEAFGVSTIEDIRKVTGGHTTSLVLRIVVRGTPYLLKIIMRTDDATRHFRCMEEAAEAGLAPHVWYTSIDDRIAITDFVNAVPLPVADALTRIPALLRSLHALPPFPTIADHLNTSCLFLLNKGPALNGFLERFRAANILPEEAYEDLFDRHTQLAAAYPLRDPEMVSSHNDLFKPDNALFDGHRVVLVDWETAFLNDRYFDLAVTANLIVTNDVEENAFLEEYFGQPASPYQSARFFLMRQLTHLFYAIAYLYLSAGGQPLDLSGDAPDFEDFGRRMWAKQVDLADKPTKIAYGRIHWARLRENMQQPRFQEAVRIVADRQACP
jgi:hypothetical protein